MKCVILNIDLVFYYFDVKKGGFKTTIPYTLTATNQPRKISHTVTFLFAIPFFAINLHKSIIKNKDVYSRSIFN